MGTQIIGKFHSLGSDGALNALLETLSKRCSQHSSEVELGTDSDQCCPM